MFSKNVRFACVIAVHNTLVSEWGYMPELFLPVDLMKDRNLFCLVCPSCVVGSHVYSMMLPSMLCGFPSGVYDWPAYICLWCLVLGCALASIVVCIWLLLIYGLFVLPKVGSV